MSEQFKAISEQVEKMILQCDTLRKVMPTHNSQARLIISTFYEELNTLKNMLEPDQISTSSPLTKKETEILEHVANGFTNKEIASALSISYKTVEYHLSSILKKSEASTRTEAVINAIKAGWLKP